jgi:multiple sugar transport system substrate-binding protein
MKHCGKFLSFVCIIVALTFILASCGKPTSTATPIPEGPLELTFWNYWDGKNGEAIQALVDQYNQENPQVKITNVFIGWGELLPKLQTAAAGGEGPDVAAVDLVWMPKMAETGALTQLSDYIEQSGVDLTDFYTFQLNVDRYGDTYYGLPVSTNNLELFYNIDLFKAAGLDPSAPPTTWDELATMAEQCANPAEGISGMELYTEPGEGLTWQFQVYLWQAGGEFLTADLSQAAFNTAAGEKALQYWVDLIQGPAPLASWGLFGQGKSCMVMDGSWMVGIWAETAPFEWGTARMPYPTDGKPATNMGGEHLIILKSDDAKQKAAWDFVNWLTSTETQIQWDEETGFMPIRDSVATDAGYISWMEETEPRLKAFVENQQFAHNRPPVPNYPELSDAFSRELEKALLGETTVQEALTAAETAVNDLLAP